MSYCGDSSGDLSEQDASSHVASSASDTSSSDFSQSSHSHQPRGQTSARETPPFDTALVSYMARHVIHVLSTLSTNVTDSEWVSYPTSTASVFGITPRFSDPREAEDQALALSSLVDPILEHFARRIPPASSAVSPIRQTTRQSTLSSEKATESDETDSCSTESSSERADKAPGTPVTSDASQEADIIIAVDQDHGDQWTAIPNDLALLGLGLQEKFRAEPLFCDANNIDHTDILNEFLEIAQKEHAHLQAKSNAIPWIPGAQDVRWPTSEDSTLAPSPGLAYNEYYSLTRKHAHIHQRETSKKKKATFARRKAQSTSFESCCEGTVTGATESHRDIAPYVGTESRNTTPKDWYGSHVEWPRDTSQRSQIRRAVDCVTFSPETLGFIFYPSFAYSHLSRSSLSTFATELVAPDSLVYDSEYTIDVSLGFGPAISHKVCTFTPKNKKDLQSYQKHQGEDNLYVQDSLPIALNLFSVESHAEELDTWLDQIIDSESRLQEYVELMQRRQNEVLSVQVLRSLVVWYLTSKNKLLQPAHRIFRAGLKLLMTTTILSLVPRIEKIPECLSRYLAPQPCALGSTHLSTIAPKLLTRQIKASIHHLQQDLLHALFCHFACALKLAAEVKVAIALLIAYVLELARNAGRLFARFASTINSTVVVKPQNVTQYEMNMQTQVFERVRASVLDTAGEIGKLGERLRNMGSILKGKGKEDQEYQFVSVILDAVL